MTRVAYLINAHRDAAQIERLVRTLTAAEGTAALIHLDLKAGRAIERELRARVADLPDVHFTPRRRVWWGRFSLSAAILDGLYEIERLGLDPDSAMVLSGQDYPIKPVEAIAAFLSESAETAYLEHFPIPSETDYRWPRGGLDRLEYFHIWVPRRGPTKLALRRRARLEMPAFGGSAFWAVGRDHRLYVSRFCRENPRTLRFFRFADVPEEMLFQTILMNSPLRERVVNDNLFAMYWEQPANHPKVLTEADLPALAESKALFARKFDRAAHPAVLDEIDARLLVAR